MDGDEDAALVERARAGDFEAFERLAARHERRLYAVAMGIVRRREDAEDVVQTALLKALEHLPGFRGDAAFGTWVTRIATNAALHILRARRSAPVAGATGGGGGAGADGEGGLPLPEFIAPWRDDPVRTVEAKELRGILDRAAGKLPEKLRLVFVLRDVAELSTRETADALGLSVANVKVRLLRARLILREELTRVFGDEAARVERPLHHRHEPAAGGATS